MSLILTSLFGTTLVVRLDIETKEEGVAEALDVFCVLDFDEVEET